MATGRRLVRIVAAFLAVWLAARLVAPWIDAGRRQRLAVWLSTRLLAVLGVRLDVRGAGAGAGPVLLVANHVSWMDVQVLNAVRAARFVAKSETRGWPVVGGIAAGFDAFFLVRGSLRDAARVKTRIAEALAAGQSVAVFPEGTTTDGRALGRFYAAFFQGAVDAGVPVQPVAIRYPLADGSANPAAAFIDDMTFVGSLLRIAREPELRARLTFASPLATATSSRRELAARARRAIAEALELPAIARAREHVARHPGAGWTGTERPTSGVGWRLPWRQRPGVPVLPPAAA